MSDTDEDAVPSDVEGDEETKEGVGDDEKVQGTTSEELQGRNQAIYIYRTFAVAH